MKKFPRLFCSILTLIVALLAIWFAPSFLGLEDVIFASETNPVADADPGTSPDADTSDPDNTAAGTEGDLENEVVITGTCTLRVIDTEGNPVRGEMVVVAPADRMGTRVLTTDGNGYVTLENMPSGVEYTVETSEYDGVRLVSSPTIIYSEGQSNEYTAVVELARTAEVLMLTADEPPQYTIEQISLVLRNADGSEEYGTYYSNENGVIEIPCLFPGTYSYELSEGQYYVPINSTGTFEIVNDDVEIEILGQLRFEFNFCARDYYGYGVEGVEVVITGAGDITIPDENGVHHSQIRLFTDADGSVYISNLPSQTLLTVFDLDGNPVIIGDSYEKHLFVDQTTAQNVMYVEANVDVREDVVINVIGLTNYGETQVPIAGFQMEITNVDTNESFVSSSDADGILTFADVPYGYYTMDYDPATVPEGFVVLDGSCYDFEHGSASDMYFYLDEDIIEGGESSSEGGESSSEGEGPFGTGIYSFIYNCYVAALGREPDDVGFEHWSERLLAGESAASVAYNIFFSPEALNSNVNASDEDFIISLYIAILGRHQLPSDAEISSWVSALENGYSRQQVFAGFVNSEEFFNAQLNSDELITINPGTYIEGAANNQTQSVPANEDGVNSFVYRHYRGVLGRVPDYAGYMNWVNGLVSRRLSGADISIGFFMSPEYNSTQVSNLFYVQNLYYTLFNRAPDDAGLSHWLSQINNGATRYDVLMGFVNSIEYSEMCARYGIIAR